VRHIFLALIISLSAYAHAEEDTLTAKARFRMDGATVVDEKTGLRWQRCSVGQTFLPNNTCKGNPKKLNFVQAQKQTNFVVKVSGFWRVPTKNELATLLDLTKKNIKIDTFIFPDTSDKNRFYWTCDMYEDGAAWYADFYTGDVGYMSGDHSSAKDFLAVRLVHVEW
jgi:hypothetical protein